MIRKTSLLIFAACIALLTLSAISYEGNLTDKASAIDTMGCSYKGFKLYGKIKIVDAFPDVKVQIVESFPDLKVKVVDHFPDECGEWQFVDSFPGTKIQFVEYFPDIKIKFVESFPGDHKVKLGMFRLHSGFKLKPVVRKRIKSVGLFDSCFRRSAAGSSA